MKEIVKVYTRYDTLPTLLLVHCEKPLSMVVDTDTWVHCDDLFEVRRYELKGMEEGLEGVRFAHFTEVAS